MDGQQIKLSIGYFGNDEKHIVYVCTLSLFIIEWMLFVVVHLGMEVVEDWNDLDWKLTGIYTNVWMDENYS